MLDSLDPRINRISFESLEEPYIPKEVPDQLQTFQVFVQVKEGKAYEHVGIVHAPDIEFAQVFAKEQYSRRPHCNGLWVVKTQDVKTTPFVENEENIYDLITPEYDEKPDKEHYEVFHLKKRGKQHLHQGSVLAGSYDEAIIKAKDAYYSDPVLNIWIIKGINILQILQKDKDIWATLPEKKHRDVTSYKAADKIKRFMDGNNG